MFRVTVFYNGISHKIINYQTKYDKKPLGQFAVVSKGTSITQAEAIPGDYKVVAGGVDSAYMHNEYNREANVITVSASGANAGYVNYWTERIFASDCSTIRAESDIITQFIYYVLKFLQEQIYQVLQRGGAGQPHVYAEDLKLIPIPDVPSSIREAVVNECKRIDEDAIAIKAKIKKYNETIEELFGELDTAATGAKRLRLSNTDVFDVLIGQRVLNAELIADGSIPVYSANVVKPFGYIDKLLISDFSVPSILWGIDGDWMTSYMPENQEFYPTDHCGVLRCKTEEVNPRYLVHILEVEGRKMGFSRSYRASIDRVQGISFYVPDIEKQNAIVAKVQELEKQISEANSKLEALSTKTADILNKYLN